MLHWNSRQEKKPADGPGRATCERPNCSQCEKVHVRIVWVNFSRFIHRRSPLAKAGM